ncbi:MAG: DNA repair protein RadA [Acidimicrobiia bacterium]
MKVRSVFRCVECGSSEPKWVGRCNGCGEWGSMVEEAEREVAAGTPAPRSVPMPITEVAEGGGLSRPTGIDELDRVLGGGLVPGSVSLVGGEPGIGKSTLLLQALASMATVGSRCLLVTAEESAAQVRARAERLGAAVPDLLLLAETCLPNVIAALDQVAPDVVVVDSVQTVYEPSLGSAPGSVAQVRECAHRLVREAKERGVSILLVGHVTKEGALAGPRVLEHVVDTVLSFEGDRHHGLRLLRAVKHRYGGTADLGLFEMTEGGLRGVPDASGLFLSDRRPGLPGSVVVPTMEGQRPLLVEVQALVSEAPFLPPRRSPQGLDGPRLALLLAVLERIVGVPLGKSDVHASVVGGVRLVEPGADLAIALAVASSAMGTALPPEVVAGGEVGLGGELRQVSQLDRRLAEAVRLGFTAAVVPASGPPPPPGMTALRASTLQEAMDLVLGGPARSRRRDG